VTKTITLLTDWGINDSYLSMVKGVISSIAPKAKVVDISHGIANFSVVDGAQTLLDSYKYFPKGTIHVCVIDPGVGSERKPILIKTKNYFFVGPDNGLLTSAASDDGIMQVYEITNKKYMLKQVAPTINGRDIFAPVAAHLSKGVKPAQFGRKMRHVNYLELPRPVVIHKHIYAEVIHIDDFGNIRANIKKEDLKKAGLKLGDTLTVCVGKRKKSCFPMPYARTFSDVPEGKFVLAVASTEFLEVCLNKKSAVKKIPAKVGEIIEVRG